MKMKFENVSFGDGINNHKGKQVNKNVNVVIQQSKGDKDNVFMKNNIEINQNNVDADNHLNLDANIYHNSCKIKDNKGTININYCDDDDDFFNDIFGEDDDVDTNKTGHNVVNVTNSGEETIVIVNGKKIVINAKGEVIND